MDLWVYCVLLGVTRTSTNYYARHCVGTWWTTRPVWGRKGRGSFLDFQSDWLPTNKQFKSWCWYKWPRNWMVWCANSQSHISYVVIFMSQICSVKQQSHHFACSHHMPHNACIKFLLWGWQDFPTLLYVLTSHCVWVGSWIYWCKTHSGAHTDYGK